MERLGAMILMTAALLMAPEAARADDFMNLLTERLNGYNYFFLLAGWAAAYRAAPLMVLKKRLSSHDYCICVISSLVISIVTNIYGVILIARAAPVVVQLLPDPLRQTAVIKWVVWFPTFLLISFFTAAFVRAPLSGEHVGVKNAFTFAFLASLVTYWLSDSLMICSLLFQQQLTLSYAGSIFPLLFTRICFLVLPFFPLQFSAILFVNGIPPEHEVLNCVVTQYAAFEALSFAFGVDMFRIIPNIVAGLGRARIPIRYILGLAIFIMLLTLFMALIIRSTIHNAKTGRRISNTQAFSMAIRETAIIGMFCIAMRMMLSEESFIFIISGSTK